MEAERGAAGSLRRTDDRAEQWAISRRIVTQNDVELVRITRKAVAAGLGEFADFWSDPSDLEALSDPRAVEIERQIKLYEEKVGKRAFIDPDEEFTFFGFPVLPADRGGRPAAAMEEKEERVLNAVRALHEKASSSRSASAIAKGARMQKLEVLKSSLASCISTPS